MNSSQVFGEPIQILKFDKRTRSYSLETAALEKLLLTEEVKNCNIAVISIAGAFRKGKSFILSFFLRYLDFVYTKKTTTDWLNDKNTPLLGFSWRGGSERNTTGIWVWSKIYVHQTPKGEKVGLMLMDTQGTFDNKSTMKDNVTIFSLSTMLSSVQIFNLFDTIQEDDLHHLQLFTEYGKLAMENSNEKAFQQLLFLIRDWRFQYESAFGAVGGQKILDNILKSEEGQDEELSYVRTHLKSCFQKLNAFLMPYPGKIATMSEFFKGQIKDLDEEFIVSLKELVPMLLAPGNVLVKKINGENIKAKNFLLYIQSYWQVFQKGTMPSAKTILGATAEANNLSAMDESTEFYQNTMGQYTGSETEILAFGKMVDIHNNISKEALDMFKKKACLGDEKVRLNYYNKLNNNLQKQLMLYLGQNEAKKSKDLTKTIDNLGKQIEDYRSSNSEQAELMGSLKGQLEDFRKASAEEKRMLLDEVARLRKELQDASDKGCKIF